jgi:hypothetical protein
MPVRLPPELRAEPSEEVKKEEAGQRPIGPAYACPPSSPSLSLHLPPLHLLSPIISVSTQSSFHSTSCESNQLPPYSSTHVCGSRAQLAGGGPAQPRPAALTSSTPLPRLVVLPLLPPSSPFPPPSPPSPSPPCIDLVCFPLSSSLFLFLCVVVRWRRRRWGGVGGRG